MSQGQHNTHPILSKRQKISRSVSGSFIHPLRPTPFPALKTVRRITMQPKACSGKPAQYGIFPRNGRPPSHSPKSRKYRKASSFPALFRSCKGSFPVPEPRRRSRVSVPCQPHFPFDGSRETSEIPPAPVLKSEQIALIIILPFPFTVKSFCAPEPVCPGANPSALFGTAKQMPR